MSGKRARESSEEPTPNIPDAEAKRRFKYAKVDYTELFVVLVGPLKQEFVVPKNFAIKDSKFFREQAAIAPTSAMHFVKLPDIEPEVFEAYLHFTYTNRLAVTDPDFDQRSEEKQRETLPWAELAEIWLASDNHLHNFRICNAVVDEMMSLAKKCGGWPDVEASSLVPRNYMEDWGGELGQLFIDYHVCVTGADELADIATVLDGNLLYGLVYRLSTNKKKRDEDIAPADRPKCYYHKHDDDFPECS